MVSEQDLIDAGMNPNAGGGVYGPGGDTSIYVEDDPTEAPPDISDPSTDDPASGGGGGGGSDPSPPPAPAPDPTPDPVTQPDPVPTPPPAPAPDPTPDLENTANGPDAGGETNGSPDSAQFSLATIGAQFAVVAIVVLALPFIGEVID